MKQHNHLFRQGRRDFFKHAALMGAAALLAGTGNRRSASAAPAPLPRTGSRYRLTAHIRRYYERASF
jgi:hypothetical protein